MPPTLNHRRLAWHAMREYCQKEANQRSAFGWLALGLARGHRGRYVRVRNGEVTSIDSTRGDAMSQKSTQKLMDYAIAVDLCADRLSADERAVLRDTGRLPDWFVAAVEEERAQLKR